MATKKIPYNPTSDYGSGILPPLVRALSHAMFVVGAHFHEWPMTVEQAQLELSEATNHLRHMADVNIILSDDSAAYIASWREQTTALSQKIAGLNATDPDQTIATVRPDIKAYSEATFGLLSKLDEDLCGLTTTQTDPGRLP